VIPVHAHIHLAAVDAEGLVTCRTVKVATPALIVFLTNLRALRACLDRIAFDGLLINPFTCFFAGFAYVDMFERAVEAEHPLTIRAPNDRQLLLIISGELMAAVQTVPWPYIFLVPFNCFLQLLIQSKLVKSEVFPCFLFI
jgi:hypothetical protein